LGIDLATWRKSLINLAAATVYEFTVETVKSSDNKAVRPNVIQIKNINSSDILYVNTNKVVTSSNYLLSISPYTTGKTVVAEGITSIFLLVASNTSMVEIATSYDPEPSVSDIEGTQDITIINQSLTVGNVGITSIAAGNNLIGQVKISDGSDVLLINADGSINAKMTASTNNIGDVDVLTLPSLAAGDNLVGRVKISDGSDVLGINADGSIDVNISGGDIYVTATEISIVDSGEDELDINTDGSINVVLSDGTDDLNINADGSLNVLLAAGTNNIGDVDILTVAAGQNVKPATTGAIYNITCVSANTEYSQALPANTKMYQIGIQSKDDTVTWVLKFSASGTQRSYNGSESPEFSGLLLSSDTLYFESDKAGEVVEIICYS
jgi:hypothetical protein